MNVLIIFISSATTLDIVILSACGIKNDTQSGFDYVNFSKMIELTFIHHPIKIRLFRSSAVLSTQ